MKRIRFLLFISIITTFIFSSCSLQKRHYRNGYHIFWNNSKHKNSQEETVRSFKAINNDDVALAGKKEIVTAKENSVIIEASGNNSFHSHQKKKAILIFKENISQPYIFKDQKIKNIAKIKYKKKDDKKKKNKTLLVIGLILIYVAFLIFLVGIYLLFVEGLFSLSLFLSMFLLFAVFLLIGFTLFAIGNY